MHLHSGPAPFAASRSDREAAPFAVVAGGASQWPPAPEPSHA